MLFALGELGHAAADIALQIEHRHRWPAAAARLAFQPFEQRSREGTVAAAEVAVGLALIVEIFKTKKNINIDEMNSLKG